MDIWSIYRKSVKTEVSMALLFMDVWIGVRQRLFTNLFIRNTCCRQCTPMDEVIGDRTVIYHCDFVQLTWFWANTLLRSSVAKATNSSHGECVPTSWNTLRSLSEAMLCESRGYPSTPTTYYLYIRQFFILVAIYKKWPSFWCPLTFILVGIVFVVVSLQV